MDRRPQPIGLCAGNTRPVNRPDDHDPDLLAQLAGEVPPTEEALEAFLAAEREAFEPAADAAAVDVEAVRMAAFVRDTVLRDESAAVRRESAPRARGWARILAFSVGLHVVVLGILAIALHGGSDDARETPVTNVGIGSPFEDEEPLREEDWQRQIHNVQWTDLVRRDLGADWDRMAMAEQETLPDTLEQLDADTPVAWGAIEHPPEVTVPMVRRRNDGLKRRRLDLLGFNAKGTLRAVERGLRVLALRQHADTGLFRGDEGEPTVRASSLATLAFLGEGHTSQGSSANDEVVARAVKALRQIAAKPTKVKALEAGTLGPLAVALSEDYMLGYGNLTLQAEAVRSREIAALADAARARLDDKGLAASDRTWLVWALDAAQRAGVSRDDARDRAAFESWVASHADEAGARANDTQGALEVGTALLYAERGADKPRFKRWSRENATSLLGRLRPTGEAKRGDAVEETALVLLALQTAYRTY